VSVISYISRSKLVTADNAGLLYSRLLPRLKRPHARPLGDSSSTQHTYQKKKRPDEDQVMFSQARPHHTRSVKTKENEAPSVNRGLSELSSSMMSNKQLKDAVIRTMSLEEIESLKMDAMRYRGARGAINQQELEEAAMQRASQLQERVVKEEIKREERKANRLLAVQRPANSTD